MKKGIVLVCLLLLIGVICVSVAADRQDKLKQYTYNDVETSMEDSIRELVSEQDIELILPDKNDKYILDTVKGNDCQYDLVLLPYEEEGYFGGFILMSEEYDKKWKTDRITGLYRVHALRENHTKRATYYYDNVVDPDGKVTVYFALGTVPADTATSINGELVETDVNGIFGRVSTEPLTILP